MDADIKIKENIEYIRKDAFIEKASWWIEDNMRKWFKNMNTHGYKMTGLMIEEFKKSNEVMKEEVVFAIIVLIMSFPIVGIIDYLIDKYGLNEEDLNHLEL